MIYEVVLRNVDFPEQYECIRVFSPLNLDDVIGWGKNENGTPAKWIVRSIWEVEEEEV